MPMNKKKQYLIDFVYLTGYVLNAKKKLISTSSHS